MPRRWFTVHTATPAGFDCPACSAVAARGPSLDHHARACPGCAIELVHWSASGGRNLTDIPALAPAPVRFALGWAQANLDEVEAVELWVALEELLGVVGPPADNPPPMWTGDAVE